MGGAGRRCTDRIHTSAWTTKYVKKVVFCSLVWPLLPAFPFKQTGGVGLENAKLCPRCTSRCFCTRVTQKTSPSMCVRDFVLNSFTQPQPNLGLSQALGGALGVLSYCLVSHY